MIHKASLLFVLVLFVPMMHGQAQSPGEILDAYYQAVSPEGIDDWYALKTVRFESWGWFDETASMGVTSFARPDSTRQVWQVKWPDKNISELFQNGERTSVFLTIKDKKYFRIGNMPIMEKETAEFFQFMPVRIDLIRKKSRRMSYLAKVDIKGSTCHLIELVTRENTWHFMFDAQSYLLRAWSHNPDDELPTLTVLDDYRELHSFLIPRTEYKEAGGQVFFYSRITDIELNLEINDNVFSID